MKNNTTENSKAISGMVHRYFLKQIPRDLQAMRDFDLFLSGKLPDYTIRFNKIGGLDLVKQTKENL